MNFFSFTLMIVIDKADRRIRGRVDVACCYVVGNYPNYTSMVFAINGNYPANTKESGQTHTS